MSCISVKLLVRRNDTEQTGRGNPLPIWACMGEESGRAACSHQRPEHGEDAGGSHDEQPAQGLRVVVLDHLNHPQQGLHPRPPKVPHVETLQVHQAGPGAVADGPLTAASLHIPGTNPPPHTAWARGWEAGRQDTEGSGSQG